jgi:2-dehydropantoate 2-reductase
MTDNKGWLIIGAGAIGLLWYSKLTDLKLKATLLHRYDADLNTLSVLDDNSVYTYELNEISHTPASSSNIDPIQTQQFSNILFCTKSFDLVDAYNTNKHFICDDAVLVTLCNGMGAQQTLDSIKSNRQTLFIGTTNEGALKLEKNAIKKTGQGDIFIGNLTDSNLPPKVLMPYYTPNIENKLLTKLAINAVINPMTALFNVTNGNLLAPNIFPYYKACRDEVCHFLKRYHFDSNLLAKTIDAVALKTANNRSSMLQDFSAKRHTEIDFICGHLLREATKVNQKLPIQSLLMEFIINRRDKEEEILRFKALI